MLLKIILTTVLVTFTTLTYCKDTDILTGKCSKDEWQCRDGTCIKSDGKCDGVYNCTDHSDETHALCRNTQCQSNWFRCMYGACVDGTAPCNGTQECVDNSDELLPRCRQVTLNSTYCTLCKDGSMDEVIFDRIPFKCDDGTTIAFSDRCDGVANCADGSDETLKNCADMICISHYFQCAYGACVDHGAMCNGIKECADNSDEDNELCHPESNTTVAVKIVTSTSKYNENTSSTTSTTSVPSSTTPVTSVTTPTPATEVLTTASTIAEATTSPSPQPTNEKKSSKCVLPPYPKHGKYDVIHLDSASNITVFKPSEEHDSFYLNYTCEEGYGVLGKSDLLCFNGEFYNQQKPPECVKFCRLDKAEGAVYKCFRKGSKGRCMDYEPPGSIAEAECIKPVYYFPIGTPSQMTCKDGMWDDRPVCVVDCGKVASSAKQLMIGGKTTTFGEFPWHAAIYGPSEHNFSELEQKCGGTLISHTVVISAAHCFFNETTKKLNNATEYAVGLGKIFRRWQDPKDEKALYFNITCIKIPNHYQGSENNYGSDIALAKLSSSATFGKYIRPICMNNKNDEKIELKVGRVAGWGLTTITGNPSAILKYTTLPFVELSKCRELVPPDFRSNLETDKFCAGDPNGTALCQGDSGGGLVFPDMTGDRYFLEGIVSTAPLDNHKCNKYSVTTFTEVTKHMPLINDFSCDT